MKNSVYKQFCSIVGEGQAWIDEPMKKHTTFRIGGPADYYISPKTTEQLQLVLDLCQQQDIPYYIIGNGSNLLVSDSGYRGAVIQICRSMSSITVDGEIIRAEAGVLLSQLAKTALDQELTGLEFASGIPGTLGGAVVMNAGAYGGEMKDVLVEATVLTTKGEVVTIPAVSLELGYRTSTIMKRKDIVLEAVLKLKTGNAEEIRSKMERLKEQRFTKQPLEYPSAGSTFKRPAGHFAGKLIMDAGMQGTQVGGAQVSEKHCGFVVNKNHATAKDVSSLMKVVQEKVKEQFDVELEPEVKFLGDFQEKE